ncbi:MAG: response regulator transcription factor [Anaerolineae bacterium]|nr:response regulator transcription factor [Anaerolineae bacterium]
MPHLLLIDNDRTFRATFTKLLKSNKFRVSSIDHPDQLTSALAIHRPDLLLMELNYPDADNDGVVTIERLREWCMVPLIVVSALVDPILKTQALNKGADDYVTKPFDGDELIARIRAVLRRSVVQFDKQMVPDKPPMLIKIRDLTIDLDYRGVWRAGKQLHLTRKEFSLFRLLVLAQGRLVTYEKIINDVWGKPANAVERMAARALVKQLRRKLGEDPANPTYLFTEPGIGYRLEVNVG